VCESNNSFGDGADQQMDQAGAAVRGHHNQPGATLLRKVGDFLPGVAEPHF
jgi:hypothetical protein